jgi:hypothetical protein
MALCIASVSFVPMLRCAYFATTAVTGVGIYVQVGVPDTEERMEVHE